MHKRLSILLILLTALLAHADDFVVSDIRVRGLQRVSDSSIANLIPVEIGDRVDGVRVRQIIRALYKTGFFEDIRVGQDGNVLVITVEERPAIDDIDIEGNKAIKTEALIEGLQKQGMAVGEIFQRVTLERMENELQRQYVSQGRYGAKIEATAASLPRNRVSIKIDVTEGKNATIRHFNIVGNTVFPDSELLELFELKMPDWFSFYSGNDKYSREKLQGDIEKLESYYQDRGYVNFKVVSSQVSVTPDKSEVYITLNVNEGGKYTVRNVDLVGDVGDVPVEALRQLLFVAKDQTFSRAQVTATEEQLKAALGNAGYTFASASGVPDANDDGTVDVKFIVETGKRAYVRRISFRGNTVTQDEVLRREMRQMEGGWASTAQIDLSKVRLERLGFFKEVNVETPKVTGTDDQIDVEFTVEEQPSGSISATLGYAQGSGLLLGANYQENNVLGTGNSLSLGISWSQYQKSLSFNFFDPYYTIDGISRGYNAFYRKTDYDEVNISSYSTDSFGAGVNFAFPIGETERLGFGFDVEHTKISEGLFPALEISEYLDQEGDTALNFKVNGSWQSSTLNRGLFATAGIQNRFNVELSVPGSDNTYYKLNYVGQVFIPIVDDWTVRLNTTLGFGDAYGSSDRLPFYEHYYAGGFGSVRGFERNTLGPRSTPAPGDIFRRKNDSFGGNLLVQGSVELLFPLPFIKDRRSVRPALFFDMGNVFNTHCPKVSQCDDVALDQLRFSLGIGVTWISGLGPLTFSISKPFNAGEDDKEEAFQFELGQSF